MKVSMVLALLLAAAAAPAANAAKEGNPVSKVFQMLADLQAKIIREGQEAQKAYDEFTEWCEDRSKNVAFEIKTGKAEVEDLTATIEKETSKISAFGTQIEELSGSISKDEADLKAATAIRAEETATFAAEEKESKEIIGTLERAIAVLSREMAKNGALVQLQSTNNIAYALSVMVKASMLASSDASRLTALIQNKQESDEDDTGAPDPAAYKGHSDGIIGTLEDLLEKAETQLAAAQKTEATNRNNFQMLKQSLEDEIKFAEKDMAEAKKGLATSQEGKSIAEGDLSVTKKDLAEDKVTVKTLHQDCMKGADDFQRETKSRGEELEALAAAKKVLTEALGASAQSYGAALDQATFIQIARSELYTGADLAKFEAVRFIRDLARKENSVVLAQLASQMSSVIRYSESAGADPFAKVKALITDMLEKLEKDAKGDASHKAYCDKETGDSKQKKLEKEYEIEKLSTKIDSMTAQSAKLKEQVAELQKQLAQLASSQAEMDKIRSEEKSLYDKNSAEMKAGIEAVKKALSVLKEYYASEGKGHSAAGGAGGGIVSMLEVVESDFTKGLAEMESAESNAEMEYESVSYQNKVARTSKGQDVKYKTKEAAGLDKSTAEAASDKEGVQAELDALVEYLGKLDKMCVAKAEPYAERKRRREAELAGLKEALEILDGESVLIQQKAKHALRGKHTHL
jgi:predicted transcriptional regulator